jgi:hypothetical protein
MSKERELLRLALEALHFDLSAKESAKVAEKIRAYLEVEPEAEPFGYVSHHKVEGPFKWQFTKELAEVYPDTALIITPVYLHPPRPEPEDEPVMLEEYDAGLLSDFGGGNIEWWQDYIRAELGQAYEHYQSQILSHPPRPELEAEPYAWAWDEIMSDGLEPVADIDKPVDNEHRTNIRPLYTRPLPARKPMTEEEIDKLTSRFKDPRMAWGFIEGIRYAEKHHEIGGDVTETDFGNIAEKRKWQGLTDEEIWKISNLNGDDYEYYRAIEQALKEKNNGCIKSIQGSWAIKHRRYQRDGRARQRIGS